MKRESVSTDSRLKLALDKGSVRSFDSDGRMRVSIANISKANICPYKGEEIPGWEDLGLERDRVYQMLRDPEELKAAAPTFNGIQLLKKHLPVDADDHQMWDIVGCTGTDAAFDGTYLTNSLSVWTKEGIAFIESGDQRELSCGYHYVPDMTPGNFSGKHYDGVMRSIEGNHVALVEEGRAGPDVVVGDSALKSEREDDMKPNRLQYSVLMRTARAINPLLATDAKIDYTPLIKGLKVSNFAARKAKIVADAKRLIDGKTVAKDASIEHLAKALDMFSDLPEEQQASLDESVSDPQHKAMEAAAHGESTLGIPKDVGEEFAQADKGKTFGDAMRSWAKDKGLELADEDYSALDAMFEEHRGAKDEKADEEKDGEKGEAEDESEEDKDEDKDGAEDEESDEEDKAEKDDKKKPFGGKDKQAKDKGGKAMDKGITTDELNRAIAAERQRNQEANEARALVRPIVGELPLALDSAEKVLRSAAKAMKIEDADTVHASALKPLIKAAAKSITQDAAPGSKFFTGAHDAALDAASIDSFGKMFPGAGRITSI